MGAAVALAALSALIWGTADYSGGRASRRASAYTTAVAAEILGLPLIAVLLLLVPGTLHLADVGWSAAAGVAGLGGLVILYRALAAGAMTLVAPITGVTGAALPVVVGLMTDAAPSAVTLAGIGCAVAAIALVSIGSDGRTGAGGRPGTRAGVRSVGWALAAGALFGLFFVLLERTADDAGLWPVAAVRLGAVPAGLLLLWHRRASLVPPRSVVPWLMVAGVGDIAANALYLVAVRDGVLAVVAPVASLYPVSTVLLALVVDRERVRPLQVGGLGLAAAALVLTAL